LVIVLWLVLVVMLCLVKIMVQVIEVFNKVYAVFSFFILVIVSNLNDDTNTWTLTHSIHLQVRLF
jgi:hypothetical protein